MTKSTQRQKEKATILIQFPILFFVILTCVGWCNNCLAQDSDQPMVDTFGNNSAIDSPDQSLSPTPVIPFAPAIPFNPAIPLPGILLPDSTKLWEKIEAEVAAFRASLPSDTPSRFRILKGLIKERVDKWEIKPPWWESELWNEKCTYILRNLPQYFPEYNCYVIWCDIYNLASSDYWSGSAEKKQEILKKWAIADKICRCILGKNNAPITPKPLITQKPPITAPKFNTTNLTQMPSVAPPRQATNQTDNDIFYPKPNDVSPEFYNGIKKPGKSYRKLIEKY